MTTKNIMIVGVGGQGSVLASKLLGHLLTSQGYDVKVSEVHGMSQRGGSVVTYVRYGDKVYSPVIDKGQADFIVSFELLEAARWIEYLSPEGQIVTSTQQLDPMPVLTGAMTYPDNLLNEIRESGAKVDALDCLKLAEQAGSSKAVNLVLLGRLSHYFDDIPVEAWNEAITSCVP
ncbi:MAG: indolepyruvate oxidoreductase subunit beta, partial [Synergistaceae bacterium]|nr:indolepyruvate oxidoreductase subunit beta [Synergistaceae bacterium]